MVQKPFSVAPQFALARRQLSERPENRLFEQKVCSGVETMFRQFK
jgi:hypothetical protein